VPTLRCRGAAPQKGLSGWLKNTLYIPGSQLRTSRKASPRPPVTCCSGEPPTQDTLPHSALLQRGSPESNGFDDGGNDGESLLAVLRTARLSQQRKLGRRFGQPKTAVSDQRLISFWRREGRIRGPFLGSDFGTFFGAAALCKAAKGNLFLAPQMGPRFCIFRHLRLGLFGSGLISYIQWLTPVSQPSTSTWTRHVFISARTVGWASWSDVLAA
jgi:hypothetical protein